MTAHDHDTCAGTLEVLRAEDVPPASDQVTDLPSWPRSSVTLATYFRCSVCRRVFRWIEDDPFYND